MRAVPSVFSPSITQGVRMSDRHSAPITAASGVTGRWFVPEADPVTPTRLFLFPHAGSGGLIYRSWPTLLPDDIDHQVVQLPGREMRRNETSFREIEPLIEALCEAMVDELDERPFALFGHCLGAQLAYRVAVALERAGVRRPVLLGISGWTPVGFCMATVEQARMPEPELIGWMKSLGSFPAETFDDPELLAMIIPALRADIELSSTYVDDCAPVSCPIVAYSGRSDPLMPWEAMSAWIQRTPSYLGNSTFPGGHFYIENHENRMAVVTSLVRHVTRQLASGAVR
jgi:surfactin synthase thioesterase subunit